MGPDLQRRRARREGYLVLGTILAVSIGAVLMYLVPWWLALEDPGRGRLRFAIFVACVATWLASYRLAWRASGGERRWALEEGAFELTRLRATLYVEQDRSNYRRYSRISHHRSLLNLLERHRPGDPEIAAVRELLERVAVGERPLQREDVDLSFLPAPTRIQGTASDLLTSRDSVSIVARVLFFASMTAIVVQAGLHATLGVAGAVGFLGLVVTGMVLRHRRTATVIVATGCLVGPAIGMLAFILGSLIHLLTR